MRDDTPGDLPSPDVISSSASPADALEALREECEEVSKIVLALPEDDFGRPTRCTAWDVKELLAHVFRNVDRVNRALAEPAPDEAGSDSISYWRSYDPQGDAFDIADRAKELAARYDTGSELAEAWDAMWREAVQVAGSQDRGRIVSTWGPTLTLDEFLKTRVLEMTVHRMDLEDALGRKGWGTDQAVSIVDEILEGLLGEQPPSDLEWDVVDFIEAGTGRRPLTEEERKILGPLADRFPLMG
ncbi:MAG: maleylpyruvate isomerase family mycothiol-dependent enzyme [Actinomycetota bacterium]